MSKNVFLIYLIMSLSMICVIASGNVVINEIEVNPPDNTSNWVELYNTGTEDVNISDWTIKITDGGWVGQIVIPNGTFLKPGDFYVAVGQKNWHHNDGGSAMLFDSNGMVIDETPNRSDFLDNDMTWGRYPDGHDTDNDGDLGLLMGTPGRANVI